MVRDCKSRTAALLLEKQDNVLVLASPVLGEAGQLVG